MRRRDLLKKGAVAGGLVWAAPLVTSSPAYAAGTLASDLCRCPDGKTTRRITSMTFEWNAGDCVEATQPPRCVGPTGPMTDLGCIGDSTGVAQVTVTAGFAGKSGCDIDPKNGFYPISPSNVVNDGGQFTVTMPVSGPIPRTMINLTWVQGGQTITQCIWLHTSCSQSICFGDEFGPLTLVSYTASGSC